MSFSIHCPAKSKSVLIHPVQLIRFNDSELFQSVMCSMFVKWNRMILIHWVQMQRWFWACLKLVFFIYFFMWSQLWVKGDSLGPDAELWAMFDLPRPILRALGQAWSPILFLPLSSASSYSASRKCSWIYDELCRQWCSFLLPLLSSFVQLFYDVGESVSILAGMQRSAWWLFIKWNAG